jgi:hypothetical protein
LTLALNNWEEGHAGCCNELQQVNKCGDTCSCSRYIVCNSKDRWSCREISTTTIKGNTTMSAVITSWESLTKWQTITFKKRKG